MRTIEETSAFRRDFRHARKNPSHRNLSPLLAEILKLLATDMALPARNRDHKLSGKWASYRECHVKPDLLLIYGKPLGALRLVRLGSHAELFDL